ncbi:hypothetical protein MNBD_NITROSPINAE02-2147 [hydrothermal vent metagenome]|uniref:YkgJ family cysteine cluster protein n=1 Tax=hydrothermal vent metagenome TaxID=652676 RepID=A0A3B1BEM8_9ZZZZ
MSGDKKKQMTEAGCEGCPALCCSDLEESILRPTTNQDVENLRWQLHFESMKVFIRNSRWYLLTLGRCMYLGDDNFCTIYEKRHSTCREHMPPDCERYGEIYDVVFDTPDDLTRYIEKEKACKKRRAKAVKKKKQERQG